MQAVDEVRTDERDEQARLAYEVWHKIAAQAEKALARMLKDVPPYPYVEGPPEASI